MGLWWANNLWFKKKTVSQTRKESLCLTMRWRKLSNQAETQRTSWGSHFSLPRVFHPAVSTEVTQGAQHSVTESTAEHRTAHTLGEGWEGETKAKKNAMPFYILADFMLFLKSLEQVAFLWDSALPRQLSVLLDFTMAAEAMHTQCF